MKEHNFLAFDIGATSGRSIIGTLKDGKLYTKELTRFPNKMICIHDKYYWDIFALFDALKEGLRTATLNNIKIDAIGIDTWGVDFVYLGQDGSVISTARSYRDPYTIGIPDEFFQKIRSRKEIYGLTGIQILNFNSLYQLYAAKKENSSILHNAANILFIPDALSYLLTGKKRTEYTILSTSQLLNPRTKQIENSLLGELDLPSSLIPPIIMPGEAIGYLTDSLAKECHGDRIPVVAVAGHDTASAVVAVPARNKKFAYLSSGTWSLMGIELDEPIINDDSYNLNFTNEGGVNGTIRFLKNITGMWLLEQCKKEWTSQGKEYAYPQIVEMSDSVEGFQSFIDPDHSDFINPESMVLAIQGFCKRTGQKVPISDSELMRCIFDSLALKYRFVLDALKKISSFDIEQLHIIGGGAQNKLLNQATANSTGISVVAGPSEATAIGNVMMQAKGLGLVSSLSEIRTIVARSVKLETYRPQDIDLWNCAYSQFVKYINL